MSPAGLINVQCGLQQCSRYLNGALAAWASTGLQMQQICCLPVSSPATLACCKADQWTGTLFHG